MNATFEKQNATFDRNDTTFDRQNATFDRQNATFERQNATFDRQNATFDRQNATFDRQNATYDRQNATYDRQNATYDRQNATFGVNRTFEVDSPPALSSTFTRRKLSEGGASNHRCSRESSQDHLDDDRLSTTSDSSVSHRLNDVGDVQHLAKLQEESKTSFFTPRKKKLSLMFQA